MESSSTAVIVQALPRANNPHRLLPGTPRRGQCSLRARNAPAKSAIGQGDVHGRTDLLRNFQVPMAERMVNQVLAQIQTNLELDGRGPGNAITMTLG